MIKTCLIAAAVFGLSGSGEISDTTLPQTLGDDLYHQMVDNHPEYRPDQIELARAAAAKCASAALELHEEVHDLDKVWACTAGFIAGANWKAGQ